MKKARYAAKLISVLLVSIAVIVPVHGLRCYSDLTSDDDDYEHGVGGNEVRECPEASAAKGAGSVSPARLCATTYAAFVEEGKVQLGYSRSCVAVDRELGLVGGACAGKNVSGGPFGMLTLTCYCGENFCNHAHFRLVRFREWEAWARDSLDGQINSLSFRLFEWMMEAFAYAVAGFFALLVGRQLAKRVPTAATKSSKTDGNGHS